MSKRILVVANDHVGRSMGGPGIRSLRFAEQLARDADVTLVVPFETDLASNVVEIARDDPWNDRRMRERLRGCDAVVSQSLPVATMRRLARSGTLAVYDLYAPWALEALEEWKHAAPSPGLDTSFRLTLLKQRAALACGDAFVCASERQRDLWLGALLDAGRIDRAAYLHDASLRSLIDVVPFGLDPAPAAPAAPVLRGVVPGIEPGDRVVLWGGGIWSWLDPLTVIRAVHRIAERRPEVKLFFLGLRHPNPAVPQMEMQRRALALADELGARDRSVFFNPGWVPHDERRLVLPRGRRRRLGPFRRARDALRVPDAAARLLLGRPARRVHPRRHAWRARRGAPARPHGRPRKRRRVGTRARGTAR